MLQKLQRKFTLIFTGILAVTLVGIFIFIGVSTYNRMENSSYDTLTHYFTYKQTASRGSSMGSSSDTPITHSSIVLTLQFSHSGKFIGKTYNEDTFSISDDDISKISEYCISATSRNGKVPGYPLNYMKQLNSSGTTIAFYDTTENQKNMRALIITLVICAVLAIGFFYVASFFLSRWCIRPIAQSWAQQQNFVADASHELKTPLTVILANTSILTEAPDATIKEKEKYIHYIQDEANHMSCLVNDMLFLAKSDIQSEATPMMSANLTDIFMNSILTFEAVAYEKNIQLDSDLADNLIVKGSEQQLAQLCNILLDNACKYTDENGHIQATLSKQNGFVHLLVNNSGAPIPSEQLPYLFDRFYRADEARTRKKSGYGLGLSIAARIAEIHHGKIEVTSSADDGTTFHVSIPEYHE